MHLFVGSTASRKHRDILGWGGVSKREGVWISSCSNVASVLFHAVILGSQSRLYTAQRERKKELKCLLAVLPNAVSYLWKGEDDSGLPFLFALPLLGVFGKWVSLLRKSSLFRESNATAIPRGSVGFGAFRLPLSPDGWGLWPSHFSHEELQNSMLAAVSSASPMVYILWALWNVQPNWEDRSGWEKPQPFGTWMHLCS